MRTAPKVDRLQFAPHTVLIVLGSSLMPGIFVVKTLGWNPVLSRR
jgi:hypothetical protein